MRHRIKKIPTLSTLLNKHKLLHSDKSALRSQSGDTVFFGAASQQPVVTGVARSFSLVSSEIPSEKVSSGLTNTYFYKHSMIKNIPLILTVFVFLLVLGCMINPIGVGTEEVAAASITEDECRRSTKVGLELIGVTGDSVNLSKTDVSDDIDAGRLSKLSQDFNVTACNAKSYKVYVQAESSLLKNQQMPDALYDVGEQVAETAFPENTWGYNISPTGTTEGLTYNTVPELAVNIPEAYAENGSTSNTGKALTITFAANFGKNKTAGHYTSDVLLSAVIEPKTAQELWNSITYMQDMTPEACAGGDELGRQLIDQRDGKSYWVAKLKDGNCWMTQNLDLDLWDEAADVAVTLTPEDSDVASEWISTTGMSGLEGFSRGDNQRVQYYDAGEYVNTKPTRAKNCNAGTDGLSGGTCFEDGWINVNDMIASSDANFGTEIVDNTYNAHYTVGNFYTWMAATVESGKDDISFDTDALESICPRGWQLPKSGRNRETAIPVSIDGSFTNLFESYGWEWDTKSNTTPPYYYASNLNGGTEYDLRKEPFYFPYSGHIANSSYGGAGVDTQYWTSTDYNSDHTYVISATSGRVYPTDAWYWSFGLSVRCVAR